MRILGVKNNSKSYKNINSQAEVQAQRMENYSEILLAILEQYAEEINSTLMAYNRKSAEETMMIKVLRRSSQETTTRKTHQENLEGIAVEIAKKLGLRTGVTRIIARNHDIGHTFAGHSGEWWLSNIKEEYGMGYYSHNALGPAELIYRYGIYDEIIERIKEFDPEISNNELLRIKKSLWIIFDGINSHNGEKTETEFVPNKEKTEKNFEMELTNCFTTKNSDKIIMPATMEGCLIRVCDKISYIPYDLADGLREGMISKIDGEYIPILTSLGISEKEIANCNVRKNYSSIVRKLQVLFTKDVIENSNNGAIRMSPEISFAMHELRNINNRRIVKHAVLQEDNEIYPKAIKEMMGKFSNVILSEDILEKLPNANRDIEFANEIITKYEGTSYEGFAKYLSGVTKEEYDFTERYIKEASRQAEENEEGRVYPTFKEKMALEFGARYISTLNDFEFFDLIKDMGLINEEQVKSLTRKYKDIGQEGLEKEAYVQKEFGDIIQEQEKETKNMINEHETR